MNLKVTSSGVIANCERIYSAFTGTMTGEEFAKEHLGKVVQTTLSRVGYELLSGKLDPEYEEGELKIWLKQHPSKFHVLVEPFGWFECFTGLSESLDLTTNFSSSTFDNGQRKAVGR
jgi:hypothetical protein